MATPERVASPEEPFVDATDGEATAALAQTAAREGDGQPQQAKEPQGAAEEEADDEETRRGRQAAAQTLTMEQLNQANELARSGRSSHSNTPDPSRSASAAASAVSLSIVDVTPDEATAKLRAQIADLTLQVTSLNGKLVQSYNRLGGLEDSLDQRQNEKKELEGVVQRLEAQRKEWEDKYEGGLLVEKDHVQSELSRMMDRVIEETASRGKAENDKATIERELAELSSQLFAEANSMVATERMHRLRAERKTEELDKNLKDTEALMLSQGGTMRDMGGKIDQLEAERDELKAKLEEAQSGDALSMSGISIREEDEQGTTQPLSQQIGFPLPASAVPGTPGGLTLSARALPALLPTHPLQHLSFSILPYQEFVVFTRSLARIRRNITTRPVYDSNNPYGHGTYGPIYTGAHMHMGAGSASTQEGQTPGGGSYGLLSKAAQRDAINDALPLSQYMHFPFLKRLQEEDTDPVLRLNEAPGLTFFSRRQVTSAIIDGNLAIEPAYTSIPSDKCSLCGTGLEKYIAGHQVKEPNQSTAGNITSAIDPRKKLGRLTTGWNLSGFASGANTPTREKSGDWSVSSFANALQEALTPSREAAGFNFGPVPSTGPGGIGSAPSRPGSSHGRPGGSLGRSASIGHGSTQSLSAFTPSNSTSASTASRPSTSTGATSEDTASDAQPAQGNFPLISSARTHAQIYLYRCADQSNTRYTLCPTYCLPRLRAVCELWTYVRTIEKGLLTEDNPKFYNAPVAQDSYSLHVRKLSSSQPNNRERIVPASTPMMGPSSLPTQDGLGLDISKKDFAYASKVNESTESLPQQDEQKKDNGENASSAQPGRRSTEAIRRPSVEVTAPEPEAPTMVPGPSADFKLNLPPSRPKRSTARGLPGSGGMTPTSSSQGTSVDSPVATTSQPETPVSASQDPKSDATAGSKSEEPSGGQAQPSAAAAEDSASSSALSTSPDKNRAEQDGQRLNGPQPPSLPPRSNSAVTSANTPISPTSNAPPRLPNRPLIQRHASAMGRESASGTPAASRRPSPEDKNRLSMAGPVQLPAPGGCVDTKTERWQAQAYYEIARLKEVTFWTRIGSTYNQNE